MPVPLFFGGEDLYRCPRRPLLDEPAFFSHIFNIYGWHKGGMLPDEGTWYDQTNAYIEVMRILDRAFNESEDANFEETRKESKKPKVKIV